MIDLTNRFWALGGNFDYERIANTVMARLELGKDPFLISKTKASVMIQSYKGKVSGVNVDGNVMVIPINGATSRNGELCSIGTEEMSQYLKQAYADPNINAIILKTNSPGGSVDGTEQLANTVKAKNKPVLKYVTGLSASAAEWIGCNADEIMVESATTSFLGSVGVMATHVDNSGKYAAEGRTVTLIRSDGSEDKNLINDVEGLTPEMIAQIKSDLAPIKDAFVAALKSGRPNLKDAALTGKVFNGQEAINLGLADSIGTLEDAVARSLYLARKSELSINKSKNKTSMEHTKLSALLGDAAAELNADVAAKIEAQLVANADALDKAKEATVKAESQLTLANKAVEDVRTQLAAKTTSLKEFEDLNLTASHAKTLQDWYISTKKIGAAPNADANTNQAKVLPTQAVAQAAYNASPAGRAAAKKAAENQK